MNAAYAAVREMARGRFWPLIALTLAGWVLLVASDRVLMLPAICGLTGSPALIAAGLSAAFQFNAAGALVLSWLFMLCAMMLPLLYLPLAHLLDRSLYSRRLRAVALFSAGHATCWIGTMGLLMLASVVLRAMTPGSEILPFLVALGVALLWQGSPMKRRLLNRGHAFAPLPAFGLAAELGSLRFGAATALWCIGSCWALMLLPLVAGRAHLAVMAVVSAIMLCERYARPRQTRASIPFVLAGSSVFVASAAAALW